MSKRKLTNTLYGFNGSSRPNPWRPSSPPASYDLSQKSEQGMNDSRTSSVAMEGHVQSLRKDPDRKGFFDLPREIRDLIYEYSVISMCAQKERHVHRYFDCECRMLQVYGENTPYFGPRSWGRCLFADRWLYTISFVSKQFAAELRPTFFQMTPFHIESRSIRQKPPRIHPTLLPTHEAFIRRLGDEAKGLRRLTIRMLPFSHSSGKLTVPRMDNWDRNTEYPPEFEESEAELELMEIRDLLHPSISILLAMEGKWATSYFACKLSADPAKGFVARHVYKAELHAAWEDYTERLEEFEESIKDFDSDDSDD